MTRANTHRLTQKRQTERQRAAVEREEKREDTSVTATGGRSGREREKKVFETGAEREKSFQRHAEGLHI